MDVAVARSAWKDSQGQLDPTKLIFLDETGANTKMTRTHGRCPLGQRLVCKIPWGHWQTTTFICGLRHDRIVAPWVLDGPMNGEAFLVYIRQVLAPTLSKDDIVVADNLSSHKVQGVREAIEARGARLLYLPPYSPDLNPIEMAFAKLKTLLRKAGERTWDAICDRIGEILRKFTSNECQNYFAHAGYEPT